VDALEVTPVFLRSKQDDSGMAIDYRNWHLGLGRRFRSLKLWFVLRSFGAEGFRKHIRRAIELNNLFAGLISESKILSLVTPPSFALSVFRLVPAGVQDDLSLEALNELNRSLFGRLSARQDIMLTQTNLNGIFCIRLVVGAVRTDEQHVRNAYDVVAEEAEGVLQAWHQTTATPSD
jgi:aromatic-L-amino-acid decarboxylase